ncbi:MAG TPA: peroxide stress protein YaaA [Candidatus Merdisoma merdipullorum]|nr:peroxide stress protein YaaA [Candidatus Merdisoma merdipullorum]
MRLIISPAKKMNVDTDMLAPLGEPVYLDKTEELLERLRELSFEEAKKLWGCNEKLARMNYERIQDMNLRAGLTPAVLSYEGIQYQYMAPAVFEEHMLSWVQSHLRILSGFYGVLKPMDGVTPYRLEMQARLPVGEAKDLYGFWGGRIYQEVYKESDRTLLNLASKEYSRCVESFLEPEDRFITCVFGEWSGGKIVQKGTYAKMARGEMVRFLAERQAEKPEEAKEFDRLGYRFVSGQSDENTYVFVRQKN